MIGYRVPKGIIKAISVKKNNIISSFLFLALFLALYGGNIFSQVHLIEHENEAFLRINDDHHHEQESSGDKNCALCAFVNFQNQIVFYPQLFFALSLICLAYVLKQKSKISISNLFFKSFARAPPVSF